MHLGDVGSSLDLDVAGYQFPDLEPDRQPLDGDSSDANWLVVCGEVSAATGPRWSFRQPSLLTWEVTDLVGSWRGLRRVGRSVNR